MKVINDDKVTQNIALLIFDVQNFQEKQKFFVEKFSNQYNINV